MASDLCVLLLFLHVIYHQWCPKPSLVSLIKIHIWNLISSLLALPSSTTGIHPQPSPSSELRACVLQLFYALLIRVSNGILWGSFFIRFPTPLPPAFLKQGIYVRISLSLYLCASGNNCAWLGVFGWRMELQSASTVATAIQCVCFPDEHDGKERRLFSPVSSW